MMVFSFHLITVGVSYIALGLCWNVRFSWRWWCYLYIIEKEVSLIILGFEMYSMEDSMIYYLRRNSILSIFTYIFFILMYVLIQSYRSCSNLDIDSRQVGL